MDSRPASRPLVCLSAEPLSGLFHQADTHNESTKADGVHPRHARGGGGLPTRTGRILGATSKRQRPPDLPCCGRPQPSVPGHEGTRLWTPVAADGLVPQVKAYGPPSASCGVLVCACLPESIASASVVLSTPHTP